MLRLAAPTDAADLADVHVTTWQTAYSEILPDDFLASLDRPRREEWWRSRLEAGAIVHVVDEGRVLGFCQPVPAEDPGWGEILTIYVLPDHWGRGLGRQLLGAAEATLAGDGFERALLWVFAANQSARGFYERMGWRRGRPIQLLELGGLQVTEVRYEKDLLPTRP